MNYAKKFENSVEFKSQAKLWLATNNLKFDSYEKSLMRRLVIFKFDKEFYDAGTPDAIKTGRVKDNELLTKLTTNTENISTIINWVIEGYKRYMKEGLTVPETIKSNSIAMELEDDDISNFIKDRMVKYDEDKHEIPNKLTANRVYEIYKVYEKEVFNSPDDKIIGFKKFCSILRSKQIELKRVNTGAQGRSLYITGWCIDNEAIMNKITLTTDDPPPTDPPIDPPNDPSSDPPPQ
jgi:phage/plasmid-associated DNA primase